MQKYAIILIRKVAIGSRMRIAGMALMSFGLLVAAASGDTNTVAAPAGTNLVRQIASLPSMNASNDLAAMVWKYEVFFTKAHSLRLPDDQSERYGKVLYSFATYLRDSGRSDNALSVIDRYAPQSSFKTEIYKGLMILKSVILIDKSRTQTGDERDRTLNEAEFQLIDLKW